MFVEAESRFRNQRSRRIVNRDERQERAKVSLGHTGDQELWPDGQLRAARVLVRKLACALACQAAREDHAAEQARRRTARCESQSMQGSARISRTSDR